MDSLDHLPIVEALKGWEVTTGKTSVSIGVVDAGIYLDHPDLSGQFQVNSEEDLNGDNRFTQADRNGIDDDGNGVVDDVVGYDFVDRPNVVQQGEYENRDPDPVPDSLGPFSFHGTAVAGIISALPDNREAGMVGVAPRTQLVALRAFGGDGRGRTDDIAAAIVYGAARGVDVLNLSFGRSRASPLLKESIQFATSQGTVVVASAGNNGAIDDPHYPSDYPDVVSVVWLAEDGNGVPNPSFSQHGIGVDLGAPGTDVFTTLYPRTRILENAPVRRDDLYGNVTGSSFSAPQVSGAAALLRSVDSTLSPIAVRSILTATAADINGVSWDHTTGAGRLDVERSLLRSFPAQTEIHSPEHNAGIRGQSSLPVIGTALDPSFKKYGLYYARGTRNLDRRPNPWTRITPASDTRAYRDTLAKWDVTALSEGAYTLRLVTTLSDGRTVEDRRRVIIDRSPPNPRIQFLGAGRVNGAWGVLADIAVDDTVRSQMEVTLHGRTHVVEGEFETSRHALSWANEGDSGGEATVQITLTNRSGLQTEIQRTVAIPPDRTNSSLLRPVASEVPAGFLLPVSPDFDEDNLSELVLNQAQNGGLSDTLRAVEWSPSGFESTDTLLARLFPRDVGDTNRDGRKEMLLQIRGATVLLEQEGGGGLPKQLIFADTSGVSPSLDGPSVHGALLSDLDGDHRGEIVGNWKSDSTRTQWWILERDGEEFRRVATLENPTPQNRPDTLRGSPEAATGDFDGDGRRDLLVGDRDGNWIIYESTGDDQFDVAWTQETDHFGTDTRFAVGNVLGASPPEFVTFSTFDPRSQEGGEFEPPLSFYSVWRADGEDSYERVYRLPVFGPRPFEGAITTADFTGNGRDEVAIVHPPRLLILGADGQGTFEVLYQNDVRPSTLGPSIVAEDFTGNGFPSLVSSTVGRTLRRYIVNQSALRRPPPEWIRAIPGGASSSRLAWRAPGADSVVVYSGPPEAELDPTTTSTDSSVVIPGSAQRQYALRAWRDGQLSPFSPQRVIRPHPPAEVTNIQYPEPTTVRLRFSESLADPIRAHQFQFESRRNPRSVLRANGGSGLLLRFSSRVTGTQGRLSWQGIRDRSGLPVGQTEIQVRFPDSQSPRLFVKETEILGPQRVRLTFNLPLDRQSVRNPNHYQLRPHGVIESVTAQGAPPTSVEIQFDGIIAGATGTQATLTVSSLRGAQGESLVEEGATVRLTRPADDLRNVFLYPNPVKPRRHESKLTIAGLPENATVRIYHPSGRLVGVREVENRGTGGTTWNLTDQQGDSVPSGIYLIRVEAPGASPVLKKAAVVR